MSDLRGELSRIYEEHGRLTPTLVLDAARDPSHPLHANFEWDDTTAAESYRLLQAQIIITRVKVRFEAADGSAKTVRRYHAVRASDEAQYDYLDVEDIIKDPLRRQMLLQSMEREWRTLVVRFETFNEFWSLVGASLKKQQRKAS